MPPDLALLPTRNGSNYPCLDLTFMVPKVFEPLKLDCTSTTDDNSNNNNNNSNNITIVITTTAAIQLIKYDNIRIFDFFSIKSIFISPNEHQKKYFLEWRSHA